MTQSNNRGGGSGSGAGSGPRGPDWITAWIEQQREQLRKSGLPGAEPADQAAEKAPNSPSFGGPSGSPFKFGEELFNAWQGTWAGLAAAGEGAGKQFADLMARMPALGLAREQTESWRELMAAQIECQRLEHELRGVWSKVQMDALNLVEKRIRERRAAPQADGGSNMLSYRELYDLWIECGEKVFAEVAHSEAYCRLQAEVGNAAIRWRSGMQGVMERGLKQFDLPTRSELNTVHKQMRELRERIAALEAQLEQRKPERT